MDPQVVRIIASKELVDILSQKVFWLAFGLELLIVLGVIMLGMAFATMMNPVEMASNSPDLQLRVGLLDLSSSPEKDVLLGGLMSKNIRLVTANSLEALAKDVREGDLMGGIVLPKDYDEGENRRLEVNLLIDYSKVYASVVKARVESVIDEGNEHLAPNRLASLGLSGGGSLSLSKESLGESSVPICSSDFVEAMYLMVVPLVLVFPILLSANMTSDSVVGEKETGTLGILMATPASMIDIILGKVLPVLGLANLQFLAWMFLLEYNVMGSIKVFNKLPLLVFLNLGALCFIGASMLISTRSRSTKESNLFLSLVIMACVFPLFVGLPDLGPATRTLEDLMLVRVLGYLSISPNVPLTDIAWQLLALGGLAAVILVVCVRSIKGLEPPPSK